ncbi:hypothetical protein B0T26DRAFT_513884 [Lasiosphaeria miniovina]|uniref:Uncharacterized protein n=1 Tax=Lasiosphaeria miniovina TaxID=1954250 RepID=A0AA39ZUJ2_9PEZI|nr:uncharacterized protein B0T26DRAFT_513884 [Lasiosphaeria miniovina]KAK0703809.1 hypothetical protein B0T26DRAFT_513884 [Lasiosphaeria miniovina]
MVQPRGPPVVSANQGDAGVRGLSKIYNFVMTPVIFVSFLVSLAIVDFRYSVRRSHFHAEGARRPAWLPQWLHRVIYRYQRYQYVARVDDEREQRPPDGAAGGQFYHSKQRTLMKMEADEAFEVRSSVLVLLGLASLGVVWAAWRVLCWGSVLVGELMRSRVYTN